MSAASTYKFTSTPTTGLNRFKLHFGLNTTGIPVDNKSNVNIYTYNNDIHIEALNDVLNGDVNVYDMLGQVVVSKHFSGVKTAVINVDPNNAVYVVRYMTNKQTTTKRIFINR